MLLKWFYDFNRRWKCLFSLALTKNTENRWGYAENANAFKCKAERLRLGGGLAPFIKKRLCLKKLCPACSGTFVSKQGAACGLRRGIA